MSRAVIWLPALNLDWTRVEQGAGAGSRVCDHKEGLVYTSNITLAVGLTSCRRPAPPAHISRATLNETVVARDAVVIA